MEESKAVENQQPLPLLCCLLIFQRTWSDLLCDCRALAACPLGRETLWPQHQWLCHRPLQTSATPRGICFHRENSPFFFFFYNLQQSAGLLGTVPLAGAGGWLAGDTAPFSWALAWHQPSPPVHVSLPLPARPRAQQHRLTPVLTREAPQMPRSQCAPLVAPSGEAVSCRASRRPCLATAFVWDGSSRGGSCRCQSVVSEFVLLPTAAVCKQAPQS